MQAPLPDRCACSPSECPGTGTGQRQGPRSRLGSGAVLALGGGVRLTPEWVRSPFLFLLLFPLVGNLLGRANRRTANRQPLGWLEFRETTWVMGQPAVPWGPPRTLGGCLPSWLRKGQEVSKPPLFFNHLCATVAQMLTGRAWGPPGTKALSEVASCPLGSPGRDSCDVSLPPVFTGKHGFWTES